MLTPPDLQPQQLIAALEKAYAIAATQIAFLPLGADADSAAFRADDWFVKLRRGPHGAVGAQVAHALFAQGITAVVAPIPARDGRLWTAIEGWRMLVYPFLDLTPASARPMSDAQWAEFGATMRRVHDAHITTDLWEQAPTVNYDALWRRDLRALLPQIEAYDGDDELALALRGFIRAERVRCTALVERCESLAAHMCTQPPTYTLCHTDLHGYNVLTDAGNRVRIVDWDAPLRAPRERDLMFVGGAQFGTHTAADERRVFFTGYGPVEVNMTAVEYFRRERIIEDLVLYARQILDATDSPAERAAALKRFRVNFEPGGTLDAATG
jgi:spectinomycin phosphotransferase